MPSFSGVEKGGIAIVAVAILWFGLQVLKIVVKQWQASNVQWKHSTEAINRNTKSYDKLAAVYERQFGLLEKQAARDERFQQTVLTALTDSARTAQDTNQKVTEIHGDIILKRRVNGASEGVHK